MDLSFWHERWEQRQIGFHEGKPNDLLVRHAGLLDGRDRVLVPLAGKTVDMLFLASRGHDVVGVEVVELACRAFFDDNGLPLVMEARPPFRVFGGGGVALWCGDMFEATPELLGTFDAVWDRAALVALDPATQRRYVGMLRALLKPGGRVLLVTFAYDQSKLPGPPWSIDEALVRALFLKDFVVEPLGGRDASRKPRFADAGVDLVREEAFLLTRF